MWYIDFHVDNPLRIKSDFVVHQYNWVCPIPNHECAGGHFKNKQAINLYFRVGAFGTVINMQREQQQQRSPYDILGVGRFTTQKEIRKRYLQLCKTYHPDISSNKNVDFREITVAYEILSSNKNQQALEIKNYNYNHKPINTNLWTKRSYIFGFALVAFTLMYSYEGKASPKVLLPHEKRKLAAQQQLPTTIVATEDQVKSNDVTPWQAAGTSFREWRKG